LGSASSVVEPSSASLNISLALILGCLSISTEYSNLTQQ